MNIEPVTTVVNHNYHQHQQRINFVKLAVFIYSRHFKKRFKMLIFRSLKPSLSELWSLSQRSTRPHSSRRLLRSGRGRLYDLLCSFFIFFTLMAEWALSFNLPCILFCLLDTGVDICLSDSTNLLSDHFECLSSWSLNFTPLPICSG